ncbi:hypothetical protein A2954_06700 [Candidatus Roizmanbacteria bacterium RIFCSPLOWO2_01_FULL_37_12]|uniref:Nucleotidyltransferase n=1 Tax=Candidatus Roizmanbacteria bacterium RIFCSPLOWO2_01_FULL_37_12 TaxID=1802056 RepID=A0A1F7I989_9BACT|nr:MAG: hypothetical protein A2768_01825 [Candidatus Roizmanbacteria bacterium RIFCSPHIGHO2_01_FULL_37_16]OGK25716.1 MAG: hypothetical protein A3D76_04880 [Candidatus Roizmanbacteria bacterium RIFCSPHIGHO2_02_FULL_37_9b]OGK39919.1 MAG: hypothetical protein A2954_06700 [Candidatus Roizmanbacteria bacterium RIFCSPLOWO2_01_FULL_37_12]
MENKAKLIKKAKAVLIYKDLKRVSERLKEAVKKSPTVFNQDATIQRFEFCFELSWKLMKATCEIEGLEVVSPKGAIRQAAVIGLIDNPEIWFKFLDARNITVHA